MDVRGIDLAADYLLTDVFSVSATYSNLNRNVFEKAAGAPDRAVENAKRHAAEVQGPAKTGQALSGETVSPSDLAGILKRVMPFPPAVSVAPPDPTPSASAQGGKALVSSAPAVSPAAPATISAPATPPLAPAAVAPAGPRAFTLEQYASLCEDLAQAGPRAEEVLRRYGLTAQERRAVDEHWATRFQAQPTSFLAWEAARKTYSEWLKRQG